MMLEISKFAPWAVYLAQSSSTAGEKNYQAIGPADSYFNKVQKVSQNGLYRGMEVVAMVIACALCPLIFTCESTYYFASGKYLFNPFHDDCHLIFSQGIYDVNMEEMKAFITKMDFKNHSLIDLIQSYDPNTSPLQKRKFHKQFTELLRSSYDLDHHSSFYCSLCEWIYTGFEDFEIFRQSIENIKGDQSLEPDLKTLKDYQKSFSRNPNLNGIDGKNRLYDPRGLGDIPVVIMKNNGVKLIRTPAVTCDLKRKHGILSQVKIIEDFKGFLQSYQKTGKTHLYVNLMARVNASEAVRSKAIEGLEDEFSSIFVITLDKNSRFYWQKKGNDYPSKNEFKAKFMGHLLKKNGPFYWSPKLGKDWKEDCQSIIEEVDQDYFKNSSTLTVKERQDYIELVYESIIETLIEKTGVDSVNLSCKSTIDRGAGQLCQLVAKIDSAISKKALTIALAPAVVTQNRLMQPDRVVRLNQTLERMKL